MVWLQRKIRQTLGSVKDQTKIGLARVSLKNNRLRDLEIGIVKATSHNADLNPVEDDKFATQFLQIVQNSPDCVKDAAEALSRRFNRTRQWVVALKCVRLLHRLVRFGDGRFEEEIRRARAAGLLVFSFFGFKDDAFFEFVRAYCLFVDEALDFCGDEDEFHGGEEEEKVLVSLMDKTPKFQRLLDCAIACLPAAAARQNRFVVVALEPVVRESFRLYAQIRSFIGTLVDKFLDTERSVCISAFEIYKKAAFQSHQLAVFYESCINLGACRVNEYPIVETISDGDLEAWEELLMQSSENVCGEAERGNKSPLWSPSPEYCPPLKEARRRDCDGDLILFEKKPILGLDRPLGEARRKDWDRDLILFEKNPILGLDQPFDEAQRSDYSNRDLILFEKDPTLDLDQPINEARRSDLNRDLILFEKDPIMGLETKITDDWEKFDSPKARQEESEMDSSSWELALDISAASASSSFSFEDPFAASSGIAPPSYVEMEDVRRKYAAMIEEQRFWQTYHSLEKHGCFQLQSYNPFCAPGIQNVPLGMMGSHGMLQVYSSGGVA